VFAQLPYTRNKYKEVLIMGFFLDTSDLKNNEIFLKLHETREANLELRYVESYVFKICKTDGTEVGICDLRIGNTQGLFFGGNIGYAVNEEHRGNHYAGKACLLLFELARRHGLTYLYITCSPENIASKRTCEFAGGIMIAEVLLPTDTEMYEEGARRKCVYQFNL